MEPAFFDSEAALEEITVRRRVKSRRPRNEQLPEHLPRYEVTAEVPPARQHCAEHGPKQIIGYDVTETLEFERPKLRVRVIKYPKFACPEHPECGVAQPPRPENPLVEGDRYDTSIAAEIVAAKYAYHLPIYRQQDWFAGSGWMPSLGPTPARAGPFLPAPPVRGKPGPPRRRPHPRKPSTSDSSAARRTAPAASWTTSSKQTLLFPLTGFITPAVGRESSCASFWCASCQFVERFFIRRDSHAL